MDMGLLSIFAIAIFMETYENHVWPRQLPSDVFFVFGRLSFSLSFFIDNFFFFFL